MRTTNQFYDANMLLSVRFACAVGSQRKSLRALWLFVGSKLTDNVPSVCVVKAANEMN